MRAISRAGLVGVETDYDTDVFVIEAYLVIDKKLRPNYNKIVKLVNRIRSSVTGSVADSKDDNAETIDKEDIFGFYFYDKIVDEKGELGVVIEKLVEKFSSKFKFWKIPFIPYKEGNTELEVLVDSFKAYRDGRIYIPDKISFYGTPGDLKTTLEFYKGLSPLLQPSQH